MEGLLDGCNKVWVHVDTMAYDKNPSQMEATNIQNRILNKVELKNRRIFQRLWNGKTV